MVTYDNSFEINYQKTRICKIHFVLASTVLFFLFALVDGLCSNQNIKKIHLTICFSFLIYTYFSFHIFNDQKSRVSAHHRLPSHQAFSIHRVLHRDGCFPRNWVSSLHCFLHLDCCYPSYPSLRYYNLNK